MSLQRLLPLSFTLSTILWARAEVPQVPTAQAFSPRPVETLIQEARAATPPQWPASKLRPDLVEVTTLDPTLRLDIRYASKDNFLGAPVYSQAKAFLQRPVAEALARVNHALRPLGFTLRIHDAYRPWWVTKVFWEATAPANHDYVADPAKGSVHNRGCAVDLDLVRLRDGAPAAMPSDYDEMSPRAHADYAGAPEEARRNRDLLISSMAAEGFKVLKEEWWHFDHATSRDYPILNLPFEAIVGRPPELAEAGQILLVTTPDWNSLKGTLQRFELRKGVFAPVGAALPVWVGGKGMAWRSDEGAPPQPAPGPVKREGDGRSPAGILTFGGMWGYAPKAPEGVRLSYTTATKCDRCVDDPDDPDYARLVHLASPDAPRTWRSAEYLRMETDHYRYMVVIHYNDAKPRKNAGSCIFFHVSPPPGGGTAGCTALPAGDLLTVLRWMDPALHPVLVQVPEPALDGARAAWSLPAEIQLKTPELAFHPEFPMLFRHLGLALLLLSPALYAQVARPTLHEALLAARADRAGEPGVAAAFRRLGDAHGTPLYIYDQAHIRGQVDALHAAFAPRFSKLRILYAIKANTNPVIIRLLKAKGLGAEVVSRGEIETALRVGYTGPEIMFTSSSKNPGELRRSIELGVVLNVDSMDELGQVQAEARRQKKQARISFRINPGVDPHTIHQINTGISESKFGLHLQDGIAFKAYEMAKGMPEIRIEGAHCHIGSQITETDGYVLTARKMLGLVKDLKEKLNIQLAFLDLGGGLGIPYEDGQKLMSPEDLAKALEPVWKEGVAAAGYEPTLWLEPGRFFVGGSGYLLTRVNTVKQTPLKIFVNVDAGFNTLMRPAMYKAYHRARVIGKAKDPQLVDIAGDVCETGDILAEARTLPRAEAGDLVVILDAGAYGFSMASEYNARPLPAEVMVEGDKARVIRRRGAYPELFRNTEMSGPAKH